MNIAEVVAKMNVYLLNAETDGRQMVGRHGFLIKRCKEFLRFSTK